MPHEQTLTLMRQMDDVRAQVGVTLLRRAEEAAAPPQDDTAVARAGVVGQQPELREDPLGVLLDAAQGDQSASAIAALDRPSAISASTSRSRGVRPSSGSRRRPISWRTTSGSSTVPPSATVASAARKSSRSLTRSLSR